MPDRDRNQLVSAGRTRTIVFYALMIVAAAAVCLGILFAGGGFSAPSAEAGATRAAHPGATTVFRALVGLLLIVVTARGVGRIMKYFGQPSVVGEIIAGIILGPSLVGRFVPIIPPDVVPFLTIFAQVGVILYLFVVGLELDLDIVRGAGHSTLAISHAGIVVPFLLGTGLALYLFPILSTSAVSFTTFALFLGVSLSVTAFPVLARILDDQGITGSRLGSIALTCAAIDDVTAWCLLALVIGIAQADGWRAIPTIAATIAFAIVMLWIVAPFVRRATDRLELPHPFGRAQLAVVLMGMLASAATTELIGVHGFFGAFLFGAIVPHRSRVTREIRERLHDVVAVLFLPVFFAYSGLRTHIDLLVDQRSWILCALITATACLGKFGGSFVASRLSGLSWKDSTAMGVLMNTRGLVELIVLNLGLDMQLISPTLFTMLVVMALVTTFMTTPFLLWLRATSAPVEIDEIRVSQAV